MSDIFVYLLTNVATGITWYFIGTHIERERFERVSEFIFTHAFLMCGRAPPTPEEWGEYLATRRPR